MNDFFTVLAAELTRRMRSRFFIIGLVVGALGIGFFIKFPSFVEKNSMTKIVLGGDPALVARARPLLKKDFAIVNSAPVVAEPSAAVLSEQGAAGAVMIARGDNGLRLNVYAKDPSDIRSVTLRRDLVSLNLEVATHESAAQVKQLIVIPVEVHPVGAKFGTVAQSEAAHVVAYIFLFLLYILILVNSQFTMTSVAEEKTSRIAELLVASVNPTTLLSAKVGASIVMALTQLVTWVAVALLLGSQTPPSANTAADLGGTSSTSMVFALASVSANDIIAFVVFFFLGFLQVSMMLAAVGSLVNRTEDLGSLSFPVIMPTVAGFIIASSALALPDATYVKVSSFVPLLSPFVMFERMVVSNVPVWQVAIAIVINVLAVVGIGILAGKLYRVGMLLYGRTPSFGQILKVLRT